MPQDDLAASAIGPWHPPRTIAEDTYRIVRARIAETPCVACRSPRTIEPDEAPKDIDPALVREAMAAVNGVAGAHDLHIWTVTSGLVALSCHVEVTGNRAWHEVLDELTALLRTRFGIAHVTLQPETVTKGSSGAAMCSLDTEAGRVACRTALGATRSSAASRHAHRH